MVEGGKQDLANQNTLQSPTNPNCCAHLHIFSLPSPYFVVVEPFQHLRRGAVFLSSVLRSWATMQGMTRCAVAETNSSGQSAYVTSALFWSPSSFVGSALLSIISEFFRWLWDNFSYRPSGKGLCSVWLKNPSTRGGIVLYTCPHVLLFCQLPAMSQKSCFIQTCVNASFIQELLTINLSCGHPACSHDLLG